MKNRQELCRALNLKLKTDVKSKNLINERTKLLNDKFRIPTDTAKDILQMRTDVTFVEDYLLYCLMTVFGMNNAKNYFETEEINVYRAKKYEIKTFKFPIKLPMIQISDDHWIGGISARELMRMKNAHLINYNPETQRTMKIIKTETGEIYQPSINKTAVSQISKSMETGIYIPNTITLNMPETTDFDFVPLDETGKFGTLVIKSIEHFDMNDGYHRYLGLRHNCDNDDNFDYPMELRLVAFSESKSRQFIYQEDQKTKMKRVDSESYNQNKYANQVIDMVNNEMGLTKGLFARSHYIINPSLAAEVLDKNKYCARNVKATRKDLIDERNNIIAKLSALFEEDSSIFESKWDDKFTIIVFGLFMNDIETDVIKKAKKLLKLINKDYSYMFRNNGVSRQDAIRLNKIISEEV